jgi:ribosomal protein S6--L-glutamate ligase
MIKHILIVTAEHKNFVPVKLKEAGEALGIKMEIIDITKTVLIEELKGSSPETFELKSGVFLIGEDGKLDLVKVNTETAIIPRLNEHHVLIKLGILKRLEKQGAMMLNTPESMELCNDKLMTQIILNSAGIKTPFSVMIQGIDEIEKVVNELEAEGKITYPFVIKTLRGTHGIGVMKVDSRASLISVAQLLAKEGLDFMLQEFCKHDRSARIIMIGKEMLAANLRGQPKSKDEFRTNSHLGSETEKYEPSEDELAVANRIVELFGANFCAIDYLITEEKEIIVLEVNGSPGLENIQKNWPDKDLAKSIIEHVIGSAQPNQVKVASDVIEPVKDEAPEAPPVITQDTIGEVEVVSINRIADKVEARIDTGAKYCSLHVEKVDIDGNWVKFKRGDITYKVPVFKIVKIRHASIGESVQRPVVKLDLTMRDIRLNQVEFTLNDRSSMSYEVLIGRNALQALGLPVIVYKDKASSEYDGRPESEVIDVEELDEE